VRNFLKGAGVALVLALGFMALPSSPAQATVEPVCGTWLMQGATGKYPDVNFGGAPAGSNVGQFSAKLVKPTVGEDPGVQFAAKNLEYTATEPTTVKVNYELAGDAKSVSGAVRLFGYKTKNANTLNDGPAWQDMATGNAGTLSFTMAAGDTLGTLGLVYDASNDGKGSVRFTGMKVGERKVQFTTCVKPDPTKTSASPSPSPSKSATAKPSASASRTAGAGAVGGPELPVTGPSMGALLGIGAGVLVLGGVLFVATRKRKTSFTS
jgi:LPXTG-motif cell wall-anchored protein